VCIIIKIVENDPKIDSILVQNKEYDVNNSIVKNGFVLTGILVNINEFKKNKNN
jgi:hypothetical protein